MMFTGITLVSKVTWTVRQSSDCNGQTSPSSAVKLSVQIKIVPLTSQKTWFTTFGWACKTSASVRQAASSAPGSVLALVRVVLLTRPHAVLLQPLLL